MNEDIYKQHILDHYNAPRNKEEMEHPDICLPAKNASCGDSFILYLKIQNGCIVKATYTGVGCAISEAAASMLTGKVTGMTVEHAKKLTETDVYNLLGVQVTLGRQKCALLLFSGLQEALAK
jgi:nitrogen fixation protein NifU and related proteins